MPFTTSDAALTLPLGSSPFGQREQLHATDTEYKEISGVLGGPSCPSSDPVTLPPYLSFAIPISWLQIQMFAPIVDLVNGHPYLSLASVIIGCAALARLSQRRSRSRLPPGPKGYPIVGNLFDLPPTHVWEKFGEWGKQYGGFSFLHPPP